AAYWTAMSLAVIADKVPMFDRHLFAFSGVSGGSLGGAVFAALARDHQAGASFDCHAPASEPARRPEMDRFYATCVHDFMKDDYLSPVLAKLVAPDFLQLLLPLPVSAFDRSRGLERSWEDSYQRTTGRPTFAAGFFAFTREDRVTAPVLLLNSTHVETGRRYIAASVFRSRDDKNVSRPMEDSGDILDILHKDVPLSAAVHNSARFTY